MSGNQILYALKISELIKQQTDAPIIWGGRFPQTALKLTANDPRVDFAVDWGSGSFLRLVQDLGGGANINKVIGAAYKSDNGVIYKPSNERPAIDLIPAWHLIDRYIDKYYSTKNGKFPLLTSLGCPTQCYFCHNYGLPIQFRKIEIVLEEIEFLASKYSPKEIKIVDDYFPQSRKRTEIICKELKRKGFPWECKIRIDNRNLLERLKNHGCHEVLVGAESGSDRILKMIGKPFNVKDIIDFANETVEHKIKASISFMLGFPTETWEEINKTINLMSMLEQFPTVKIEILLYTPYPHTKLYNLALKEGFIPPKDLDEWGHILWEDQHIPSTHKNLSLIYLAYKHKNLRDWVARSIRHSFNERMLLEFYLFGKILKSRWDHRFFDIPIDLILYKKVKKLITKRDINKIRF